MIGVLFSAVHTIVCAVMSLISFELIAVHTKERNGFMELRFARTKKGKMLFAIFAIMLIACIALPVTVFAVAETDLERLTDPEVMRMVHRAGQFQSAGRNILWHILIWLAQLIDYFQTAVSQITNFNLYNLIKNQFDINAVVYPIAWASASVAIVFVSVLLIYNADKTRLSDFARGILTSIMLIIALPALISALSDLRTTGVDYVISTTGQETEANSEGIYFKETLGQKALSPYVYYTVDSIQNNKKTSIRGNSSSTWGGKNTYASGYAPSALYNMDINEKLPYSEIQYYISDVDEYPVAVQHKYSEINYEIRRELCGVNSMYNDWMEMRDGKDPKDEPKAEFAPSITLPNGMQIRQSTQSYSRFLFSTGNPWTETYEYFICTRAADYVEDYLINYGVDISRLNLHNTISNANSLANGLKKLDSIYINIDGREFSVMEYLNAKNNEKLSRQDIKYVGTGQIKELLDDTEYANKSELEQVWLNIISLGDPLEHVYKYDFDFLWAFLSLIILCIALFFAGLKLAGLLYDILFAQIVVPIIVASDMNSSGKAKAAVQNLINTFLIFIIVNLLLRLYILILGSIHTASDLNFLAKIILILAGAKFVIDGPDIVTKILGIDAGVKSGAATLMGVRSAVQMGTSAIRTAKTAAGKVNSFGGAVGGMTAGTISGIKNGSGVAGKTGSAFLGGISGASTGSKAGGLIGGAGAGSAAGAAIGNANGVKDKISSAFGNTASGQAFKSKANEQTRTNETYSSSSTKQGVSGDSNSNASISSSDSTPSSGGSDSSSHTSSHTSSESSAPVVGGAFANSENAVPVKGEKGDKGDKGDQGNDGLQGIQGQRGETGEKGKDAERSNEQHQGNAFSNSSDWSAQTRASESNTPTYAEQARATEHSTPSFAEQSRASENNAPTFAERAYRSEQPSAPSSPSPVRPEPAPSTHSEPSVPNPQPAPKTSDDKGKK